MLSDCWLTFFKPKLLYKMFLKKSNWDLLVGMTFALFLFYKIHNKKATRVENLPCLKICFNSNCYEPKTLQSFTFTQAPKAFKYIKLLSFGILRILNSAKHKKSSNQRSCRAYLLGKCYSLWSFINQNCLKAQKHYDVSNYCEHSTLHVSMSNNNSLYFSENQFVSNRESIAHFNSIQNYNSSRIGEWAESKKNMRIHR